jgi:hypothetical protein
MLKKLPIIIIGILLSFVIIHEVSVAADATPATKPAQSTSIKICQIDKLNTYLTVDAKTELEKALAESDGDSNALKIRVAFEKARKEYHDTVKCVFDVATIEMLGSAGGVGENFTKDKLPDLTQALTDINKPDKVCPLVDNGKLKAMVNGVNGENPANLVPPLLGAYNNYSALISYFVDKLQQGTGVNGTYTNLNAETENYKPIQLIMENEVQDSIMALDSAMQTLKELRISFVMHVRFECMLKNLELYRRLMANLRSIVTVMPSIISNASMHK